MSDETQNTQPTREGVYFSASEKAFYHSALKVQYGARWPADAVAISDLDFAKFWGNPPAGKVLGSDTFGAPCWVDTGPAVGAAQQSKLLNAWVSEYLDATAQEFGYDNILSAVSYVGDTNATLAAEGVAFKSWRSAVWSAALPQVNSVQQGTSVAPTHAAFVASLPVFIAPAGSTPVVN